MSSKRKAVFKDEVRDEDNKGDERAVAIRYTEIVLANLLAKRRAWDSEDMVNIKSMIHQISNNKGRYPPPLDEATGPQQADAPASDEFLLTEGVADALYNREELDLSDVNLHIIFADEPENVNVKLPGDKAGKETEKDVAYRRWKLNAIDGDGNVITLRLDSCLCSEGKFFTAGTVINVTSAFTAYLNYGDQYDMRCAIVLRECRVLGRRPVPDEFLEGKGPPQRLTVSRSEAGDVPGDDVENADSQAGECRGNQCSLHDIDFAVCVTKTVPIESISLKRVARECVFVTKAYKDMDNRNKRFLLYYYYATSVYQFHGKGNRVTLPDCLVSSIRRAYPDES